MDGVVFQRQKSQPGGSWVPSGPNVVILVSSPTARASPSFTHTRMGIRTG